MGCEILTDEEIVLLSDEEIGERLVDLAREKARLAAYCQGDHIKPRSQGGETTQDNSRHKCGHDNRWAYNHEQRLGDSGPDPPDTG